jgi:hypothetical protein
VGADNLQPYLLAINRVYKDHGLDPVAQGDLVDEVIKGLQGVQTPLVRKKREFLFLRKRHTSVSSRQKSCWN